MKIAVLYYSRTGTTAVAAKALSERINGDLIEIKDLKNREGVMGWLRAGRDAGGNKTTQIEPSVDTSDYDTLCLGTPVWNNKPSPAFNTMIKNFEVRGKDVVLFVTSGGSVNKPLKVMSNAVEAVGGNVLKTFAITGKKSEEEIKDEINSLTLY